MFSEEEFLGHHATEQEKVGQIKTVQSDREFAPSSRKAFRVENVSYGNTGNKQ